RAQLLQGGDARGIALDVGERGEVIARMQTREVGLQPTFERRIGSRLAQGAGISFIGEEGDAVGAEYRRLRRQGAAFVDRVGEVARRDLARLDVRLIERIDAEDRAGNRGRHFPTEELLTEMRG